MNRFAFPLLGASIAALAVIACTAGGSTTGDETGRGASEVKIPCGPNTCNKGEVCCNASCGICTQPGFACTQEACAPAK